MVAANTLSHPAEWLETFPRHDDWYEISPTRAFAHPEEMYDEQYRVDPSDLGVGQGAMTLVRHRGCDTAGAALEIGCGTAGPPSPRAGTVARTVIRTPGAPSTITVSASMSRAKRPAIARSTCCRVRATPSAGPRSSVAA